MPPRMARSWISVMELLASYYVLVRPQIQSLVFPTNKHSRFCRKVLNEMVRAGLIGRTRKCVTYNENQTGCPIFYLTMKGKEALAEALHSDSYLLASTSKPRDDRLEHQIGISEIHLRMNAAFARQSDPFATMPTFLTEWNRFRPDAGADEEFFLHVQFPTDDPEKPFSCSPDSAAVVSAGGKQLALYIECCLGTSSVGQVIGRKHRGYQMLAATDMFRTRHFPQYELSDFRVLVITTNRWRRNQMSRLMRDHTGSERWRFATWDDFQPKHILHEKFMLDCHRKPTYLIKPPENYHSIGVDLGLPVKPEQLAATNGQLV